MLLLTQAQRGFVIAMLETGGQDHTKAAVLAGFGNNVDVANVSAARMMRQPKILAAIREEADRRLKSGAILGASVLIEIMQDTRHKDRFKAAQEVLNRAGLMVEQTHRVIHEDHRTDAEVKRSLALLLGKYGVDAAKVLGGDVVDAEFSEVTGAEGLEDLL
jgi:phage terminase small subunit